MGPIGLKDRFKRPANVNTWIALATLVTGIAIWLLVPHQVDEPPSFFGQINAGLSPKLFPQLAAIGFIVTGIFYLVASFRMPGENTFKSLTLRNYLNLGIILVVMVAYVALLRPLGFIISSGLTALVISLFYGSRNVIGIALVCVGTPVAVYFTFTRLLGVSLPSSPWLGL